MTMHLPQEIIDDIIDQLQDSPPSLKTCTWVSHSWLRRARKHLFHSFTFPPERTARQWAFQLDSEQFTNRIRLFISELNESTLEPSLAELVSVLTINFQQPQLIPLITSNLLFSQLPFNNLRKLSLEKFPPFNRCKPLHFDSFGELLRNNPYLESLALVRTPFLSANEFIRTMQTISTNSSEKLCSLSLYGVQVPRLKESCLDSLPSSREENGKCPPRLQTLDLRCIFDDFWMVSLLEKLFHDSTTSEAPRTGFFDLGSVQTVVLGTHWYLYDKVLKNCPLISLRLDVFLASMDYASDTAFCSLVNLTNLEMYNCGTDRRSSGFLVSFITTIPILKRLETFSVAYHKPLPEPEMTLSGKSPEHLSGFLTPSLDSALSVLHLSNPCIKKVTLALPSDLGWGVFSSSRQVYKCLPKTHETGLLNIVFGD
ncbi:hypothetical protein K435DRAFT_964992 [Dendrothele bispora CBS 962.96]|uniref:F-box domain-containing protein n=1 Tax=Dendrothele bispora (strain CBS 962.96) TaxID=1314807 RepID=A0A4S8M7U2_DENBC|nr:hypothetical protein K435DRAFT_964992 [Dendrothele bispora CBS 962.96]